MKHIIIRSLVTLIGMVILSACGGGGGGGGGGSNHAPAATAQTVTTAEDTAKAITLTGTDADGDGLTYAIVSDPAHGTLSGTAPDLTYTPTANFNGPDSFTFTVNDGTVDSSASTVTITVSAVNDIPVAIADTQTVAEDATTTSIDVLANDSDTDGDTLQIKAGSVTAPNRGGTAVINGTQIDYTPPANFNGTETFDYTVNDGTDDGNTVTVTVTVSAVNDAPVATADIHTVAEDAAATSIDVLANDSDVEGDTLQIKAGSVTAPNRGGTAVINGTQIDYTPPANFNGTETFDYTVNDGTDDGNTVTVTVTVTAVNDAPVASDFNLTLDLNASMVSADWEINASAEDVDGDALAATVTAQGTHGTCAISGTYMTYLRTSEAEIADHIDHCTLRISDGHLHTSITVTIDALYWKQIATGMNHSCGIKSNDTLWCWGDNTYGQLGIDYFMPKSTPTQEYKHFTDWKQVAVGYKHTVAIRKNGTLWSWGNNAQGQLGTGDTVSKRIPTQESTHSILWQSVSAGMNHTLAIKKAHFPSMDRTLFGWGSNLYGQLGVGDTDPRNSPTQEATGSTHWLSVSTSGSHTLALKTDHTLFAWGFNANGQLGVGDTDPRNSPTQEVTGGTHWVQITAGSSHSVAITDAGLLYAWGWNARGQLGVNDTSRRLTPTREATHASNWAHASAGGNHTLAVKTNGQLFAWGVNNHGELGDGTIGTNRKLPTREMTSASDWVGVIAGRDLSLAIKSNGRLWAWGANYNSRYGDGTPLQRTNPTQLFVAGSQWIMVSSGTNHTVALLNNGTIWSWGNNSRGQLGDGSNLDRDFPVQESTHNTNWTYVAAGNEYTVALKNNGTIWSWGRNSQGQLATNDTTSHNTPTREHSSSTHWTRISAGYCHTVALKDDHTLWSWGCNDYGQLGIGDTNEWHTPIQEFTGATDWMRISAGGFHTAAIKTTQTLWTWGKNNYGQLGLNDLSTRTKPFQEHSASTNWIAVSAGRQHTVALKSNHSLWAWGYNAHGQLGIGNRTDAAIPIREATHATNWEDISAGLFHTLAAKQDRSLWGWGDSACGELGNGTLIGNLSPALIDDTKQWGSFSAGRNHSIGIDATSTSTLWGWGSNRQGQLGTDQLIYADPQESIVRH